MRETISLKTREEINHEIRNVFQTNTYLRTRAKMAELEVILGAPLGSEYLTAFILLCANAGYLESLDTN